MSGQADANDNTKEKRKENLEIEIHTLDQRIDTATENGLFNGQKELRNDIINQLQKTRDSFDGGRISECETNWSITWGMYSDALNSKEYSWRLFNLHAIHIWLYLVAILVAIFSIYYFGLLNCPTESATIENGDGNASQLMRANIDEPKAGVQITSFGNTSNTSTAGEQCYLNKVFGKDVVGFYAVTWGCIGAVLRGFWYLKENVDNKLYRNSWSIYFLSAPFLGGILGVIVYFIIMGGIISVTSTNVNIQHSIPVILFATLAGFNWEWAIKVFRKIGDSLSPVENESK